LRRLRIAASRQLLLVLDDKDVSASPSFWDLPEETRFKVLGLLGQMIARGVVADSDSEVADD
jgi:hypothetical protein